MALPVLDDMAEEVYHREQRATKWRVSRDGRARRDEGGRPVAAVGRGLLGRATKAAESLPASSRVAPTASMDLRLPWVGAWAGSPAWEEVKS
jgi:hypothetical protein